MRWCVAVLLLAMLVVPSPASACSCGSFDELTPETCRGAKRVFAGTVAAYERPNTIARYFIGRSFESVGVELAVDRVWKSDVPDRVFTTTGMGGGDCGIHPPVGTRFVVCDDDAGDAAPSFLLCSHPKFETSALEAALGPSHAAEPFGAAPLWVGLLVGALVVAVARSLRATSRSRR
jgi:hypothetical protein